VRCVPGPSLQRQTLSLAPALYLSLVWAATAAPTIISAPTQHSNGKERHFLQKLPWDPWDPGTMADALTPGRRAVQLQINYARSALSSQCAPGTPAAGWRAPDAALQPAAGGAPVRVYELMRGTHHTLLAFGEPGDAVLAEAAALQARLGALVRLVTVGGGGGTGKAVNGASAHAAKPGAGKGAANGKLGGGRAPAVALACTDSLGEARERYGVTEPCAFLIRPDGYIGVARAPAGALTEEVSRRFM